MTFIPVGLLVGIPVLSLPILVFLWVAIFLPLGFFVNLPVWLWPVGLL